MAIEVASRQKGIFSDGAGFVSLAPLRTHTYLVPAIADVLSYSFQGQLEPRVQLLNYLRTKEMLLVLDNAEHLLAGVDLFSEILEESPGVKLLVTSRERMYLQAEWVFEIQGLPVPPTERVDRAEQYSAVALFIQSAQRAKVGFELPAEERSAVVHICQLVEGMPLGIELAAAWVSLLSCIEIAEEIERSLDFLASTMRDVPERLRSLRAAFDHSWKLLSEDERQVLSRLSIFRGGFDRQAAKQVAGATLPSLLALTSKSLLMRSEAGHFDLHEVIRQYAFAHLYDDPDSAKVHDLHSEFYLSMLLDREKALKSGSQRSAMRELTNEIDNLRAAWSWAVKGEKYELIGATIRSLGRFYEIGGWLREGVEQIAPVVELLKNRTDLRCQKVFGLALAQQGLLLFRHGRFKEAEIRFQESLNILRPIGDPASMTDPLVLWGIIMHLNGDIDQANFLLEEGLQCALAAGDRWFEAYAIYNQGYIASLIGNYSKGYELMLEGLAMWRELGEPQYTALGLNHLTPTLVHFGFYEQAHTNLKESLMLCEKVGDRWGLGTAHRFLGVLYMHQGDLSEAQYELNKSLQLFSGFTTGWDIVQTLVYLGETAVLANDLPAAHKIYLDAIFLGIEANSIPLVIDSLIGMAEIYSLSGEAGEALFMSIYVQQHPATIHETKSRADKIIFKTETKLSHGEIKSATERAENLSLEQLAADILGEVFVPTEY